jgi:hypothetical protein
MESSAYSTCIEQTTFGAVLGSDCDWTCAFLETFRPCVRLPLNEPRRQRAWGKVR